MNIFNNIQIYRGKWSLKSSRKFNEEELKSIKSAKIVTSDYGLSVCFMMANGGTSYIPLSETSMGREGDSVDLKTANLLTLERQGDNDIFRVEI